MKLPPRDKAEEAARVATREALERFGYRFPSDIWQLVGIEWRFREDHYLVQLRIAQDRPEDSILLTSARVGPTLDEVTVEVFHHALRALGVSRDPSDEGSDVTQEE